MRKLDRVAEAIMVFEGWKPGSASYRRSNPGNLRWGIGMSRLDDGYAFFDTFENGWKALVHDLFVKCAGLSKGQLPNGDNLTSVHSLYMLFEVYAPSSDSNRPHEYAEFVAKRAGIDPNDPIGNILKED